MKAIASRVACASAIVGLALLPSGLAAKSANSLNDLVGARAAGAESDLQSRGWVGAGGHKSASASYTYWWNGDRRDCVMVTTRDGRYASIVDATPADCNQSGGGSGYEQGYRGGSGMGDSAGYQGNDHGNRNGGGGGQPPHVMLHKNGTASATLPGCLANFDRNGVRTSSFSSCRDDDLRRMSAAVVATMRENRQQDSQVYHGENRGAGPVDVSDLVGSKAAGVESDLKSRGFRSVDGFDSGNDKGTIWWNGRTRQCLQMITVDGRANSITDIHTHPRCR
jgi:hypothetical protein